MHFTLLESRVGHRRADGSRVEGRGDIVYTHRRILDEIDGLNRLSKSLVMDRCHRGFDAPQPSSCIANLHKQRWQQGLERGLDTTDVGRDLQIVKQFCSKTVIDSQCHRQQFEVIHACFACGRFGRCVSNITLQYCRSSALAQVALDRGVVIVLGLLLEEASTLDRSCTLPTTWRSSAWQANFLSSTLRIQL